MVVSLDPPIGGSRLSTGSYESRLAKVLPALRAQPYWEAARIFALAYGKDKTVHRTDNGFVTRVSYVSDEEDGQTHAAEIFTPEHPCSNIDAALTVAGLGSEAGHWDAMSKHTWGYLNEYFERWNTSAQHIS